MKRLSMRILQSQLAAYQSLGWTEVETAREITPGKLPVTLVEHDDVHAFLPCKRCGIGLDYTAFVRFGKCCSCLGWEASA